MTKFSRQFVIATITILAALAAAGVAVGQTAGKAPVIIIPGVTGTQLINPMTENTVWFSITRDKEDDLRLPMTSAVLAENGDTLRIGDIIRAVELPVLPDVEVYDSVIKALQDRGYTEATWDKPQATDVFYVFPYDWRRDNVETAHLLMNKMAGAKAALKKPGLKFDILAHSMGGLVARYAAMYGMADLPVGTGRPNPTWDGAAHIGKLMMFGTPNEGSFGALDVLLNGYPIIAGRNLPLVDDLRPEDVLTAPSNFQLLPHAGSARF
ncbi:MAG: esterase/lipase family protein, partial [Pyrinomonadaceae bacterium]